MDKSIVIEAEIAELRKKVYEINEKIIALFKTKHKLYAKIRIKTMELNVKSDKIPLIEIDDEND